MFINPLAQTFTVSNNEGIFLHSVDLFFQSKDINDSGVSVCIVRTKNGIPSEEILPFGFAHKTQSEITTSTIGNVASTFVFQAPIYIYPNIEYAMIISTNSTRYNLFSGTFNKQDLLTSRTISKQPIYGNLFKSSNTKDWRKVNDSFLKYNLNRCKFNTNVSGSITLKNEEKEFKTISNPFETTTATNTVIVRIPNHGLENNFKITFQGITENQNGIPFEELNDTFTVSNVDFDSFEITTTTNANTTGICGGVVEYSQVMDYDVLNIIENNLDLDETQLKYSIKTTNENKVLSPTFKDIVSGSDVELENTSYILDKNDVNETFNLKIDLSTKNDFLSPIVDLDRIGLITVKNRINELSTNEENVDGGDSIAKYISKNVKLVFSATGIKVLFTATRPVGSNIKVYIKGKPLEVEDINEISFVELNQTQYPVASNDEREYEFTLDNLEEFNEYIIKIVMISESTSRVPKIRELRGIALL